MKEVGLTTTRKKRKTSPDTGAVTDLTRKLSETRGKLRKASKKKTAGVILTRRAVAGGIGLGTVYLHKEITEKSKDAKKNEAITGALGVAVLTAGQLYVKDPMISDALGGAADVHLGATVIGPRILGYESKAGTSGIEDDVRHCANAACQGTDLDEDEVHEELGFLPAGILMMLIKQIIQNRLKGKQAAESVNGALELAASMEADEDDDDDDEDMNTGSLRDRFKKFRSKRKTKSLRRRARRKGRRGARKSKRAQKLNAKADAIEEEQGDGDDDQRQLSDGEGDGDGDLRNEVRRLRRTIQLLRARQQAGGGGYMFSKAGSDDEY